MPFCSALPRATAAMSAAVCFGWMLLYPLLGGSSFGRSWLFGVASRHHFDDEKSGAIMIFVGFPILFAGTVCSLLATQTQHAVTRRRHQTALPRPLATAIARVEGWLAERGFKLSRDVNYDTFAFIFILFPLFVFVVSGIVRKGGGGKSTANMFGMLAIVATSFVLVPVSRQSPIYHALGINPLRAVRMHMWSGSAVTLGAFIHGFYYIAKWTLEGDELSAKFISPRRCWPYGDGGKSLLSSSVCYEPFRNLFGFIALSTIVVIGIVSFYPVRRYWYRLFYITHIIAAPLIVVAVMMHYNRAVLYFAPGVIYYVASSFPVLVESFFKRFLTARRGVRVLAVDYLPDGNVGDYRPCVSLTIAASDVAMHEFRSGMYVHVTVPTVDKTVAHPFTINRVPGEVHQLRIIFRAMGSPSTFTRKLSILAKDCATSWASGSDSESDGEQFEGGGDPMSPDQKPFPPIFIDGYFGPSNRLEQILNHDTVFMVAAGIGITPYLSLLEDIVSHRASCTCTDHKVIHHVTLHWICRDQHLIKYIEQEHFDRLRSIKSINKSDKIMVIIHNTRSCDEGIEKAPYSDNAHSDNDNHISLEMVETSGQTHAPANNKTKTSRRHHQKYFEKMDGRSHFIPSHFSSASRSSIVGNIPSFLTFAIVAWTSLWFMWYVYTNLQSESQVPQRSYALAATIVIGFVVALSANIILIFVPAHILHSGPPGKVHGGKWWGILGPTRGLDKSHASDMDDSSEESGIECANLGDFRNEISDKHDHEQLANVIGNSSSLSSSSVISVIHGVGRPSIGELLLPLQDSHRPGLLYCVPVPLANELKQTLRTQRDCSYSCTASNVTIYEESFCI